MAPDLNRVARLRRQVWIATLLLGGCNWYYDKVPSPDDLMKLVPWFDHMVKSPAVHPYEKTAAPRDTPKGTVPVTGAEADWGTGDPTKLQYGFDTVTAAKVTNPLARGTALEKGDTVFTNYCAVCHGPAGDGKGPVGPRLGAPSLLTDRAKGYSDGYLYSIIRYGRGVMPQYGDKVFLPHDRWAAVNYVRQLQGLSATPAAPAPVPPPPPAAKGASR
jgi:mono/diheme cytochrome c family protein